MGTDKKENFKRIAELRTNKILQGISLLGNLANKSYYEYTDEQIEAIFDAIQKELNEKKRKLIGNNSHEKKFRL